MATGGFKVDHRTDRTLIGAGKDFATLRKGFAPLTERFGVLGISVIKAVLHQASIHHTPKEIEAVHFLDAYVHERADLRLALEVHNPVHIGGLAL